MSVSGIRGGNFIDLGKVLRWSNCFQKAGTSIYGVADAECGGYVYGSALLRTLNLIGMNALQAQFWRTLGGVGKVTTWHLLNIYTDYVVGFVKYLTGHEMRHEHRIST